MQFATPAIVILIPFLALASVGLIMLAQGLRITDEPSCSGCGAQLKQFGPTPEACPDCDRRLTRPRDIRFEGKQRPFWLWAVAGSMCLPVLLIGAIILTALMGWVTEKSFARLRSPGTIQGTSIASHQAWGLTDDELIATLARAPNGPDGWGELLERIDNEPQSDDRMIAIIDTVDTVVLGVKANPLGTELTPDMSFTLDRAFEQLGHAHPRVQLFLSTHLLAPKIVPKVIYNDGIKILHERGITTINVDDDGLSWVLNAHQKSLTTRSIITAIRIDGVDYPPLNSEGKSNWNGVHVHNQISSSMLPENATQPGEHTIEFDLMNIVVPGYLPNHIPIDQWPSNLVSKETTLQTTYTVPERNPAP